MDSYEARGKIPKRAFLASSIALFVFAVILALVRTTLRVYYYRRLFLDDGFLLFAFILLCTCMGLYVHLVDCMYVLQASIEDRVPPSVSASEIKDATLKFHLYSNVFIALSWTVVIAVKYSFLFFFKMLIRRIRKMEIYWRCLVGVTTIMWVAGIVGTFASCPYFDDRALSCVSGKSLSTVTTILFYTIIAVLDIVTDLAIIAIPVTTLHKVRIKTRVKLLLGASLCVSAIIMTVPIIQIIGFHLPGQRTVDIVWEIYWQYVEACIAIIVVCLAAFRSFFVQHMHHRRSNGNNNQPPSASTGGGGGSNRRWWYVGFAKAIFSSNRSSSREKGGRQDAAYQITPPPPPPAVVGGAPEASSSGSSGLRTYIEANGGGGGKGSRGINNKTEKDDVEMGLLQALPQIEQQNITVQHDLTTHWERIDPAVVGSHQHSFI